MTDDSGEIKSFKLYDLNKASRPVQIVVMGLLVGLTLFGGYCLWLGIGNMFEKPVPISNGTLNDAWCYEDNYYVSKFTHEVTVYNCNVIPKQSIWIGSLEEYYSWKNMRLMDGKKHMYTVAYKNSSIPDAQFEVNEVGYKSEFVVRLGNIANKFDNPYKFIIVPNDKESDAIMYSIDVAENTSYPKIDIKIIPTVIEKSNSSTYYTST